MKALVGGSLLSAAAYMPVHALPVLIAAVIAEGRATVSDAGWIVAAFMIGQLAPAILLPAARFRLHTRSHAVVVSVLFIACLSLSTVATGPAVLLFWFFAGVGSGALYYLGTIAIASFPDASLAFSVRLAFSLVAAATALICIYVIVADASYNELIYGLSVVLAIVVVSGMSSYRPPIAERAVPRSTSTTFDSGALLCLLYLLFVGQIGYWVFALQTGKNLGMHGLDAVIAIAVCKFIAALVLSPIGYRDRRRSAAGGFLVPGSVAAGGILTAVSAPLQAVFLLALLTWEIGFNVLSARLQAKAVQINPSQSGFWITAAIFLGGATGPALQGQALSYGVGYGFIAFAVATALLPSAWDNIRKRCRMYD